MMNENGEIPVGDEQLAGTEDVAAEGAVAQTPCGSEGPGGNEDNAPEMTAEDAAAKIRELAEAVANKQAQSKEEDQKLGPIIFQPKARIEWLNEAGEVAVKEMCLRSLPEMMKRILSKIPDEAKEDDPSFSQIVRVTAIGNRPGDAKDTPAREVVKFEGPAIRAVTMLGHSIMAPETVSAYLFQHFERVAELSELKGLLITVVAGDAQIGGWAYLSPLADVTDTDKVTLAEASAAQAAMFKDKLQQQFPQLKFPSDTEKSRIIIPGM